MTMDNRAANNAAGVGREFASSIGTVIRSEIKLAKAEGRVALSKARSNSVQLAIFAIIAAFGIIPLMAFAVIGLGRILADNYWLSSLIIGLLMTGVFGFLAVTRAYRIRDTDFAFPNVRESFEANSKLIDRKVTELSSRRST